MRFHHAVLLAALAIAPVCAERLKASPDKRGAEKKDTVVVRGRGGDGDNNIYDVHASGTDDDGSVIYSRQLLLGGYFSAQHSSEAMIFAAIALVGPRCNHREFLEHHRLAARRGAPVSGLRNASRAIVLGMKRRLCRQRLAATRDGGYYSKVLHRWD